MPRRSRKTPPEQKKRPRKLPRAASQPNLPQRSTSRREAIALGLAGTAAWLLPGCESITAPRSESAARVGESGPASVQSTRACQECVDACFRTFERCRARARARNCGTDPAQRARCALQVLQDTQKCYADYLACVERCGDVRKLLRCINRKNEKLFRFMLIDARRAVERIDGCVRRESNPERLADCIYTVFIRLAEDIDTSILDIASQIRRECCEESGT